MSIVQHVTVLQLVYKIKKKLHLIQSTVLMLWLPPAILKYLLGEVLFKMESSILLVMLKISVERFELKKKNNSQLHSLFFFVNEVLFHTQMVPTFCKYSDALSGSTTVWKILEKKCYEYFGHANGFRYSS